MRLRLSAVVLVALWFAVTLPVLAQMEMPKPAPELKKLDYFVGTWVSEGETKPTSMEPGGKWKTTDRYQWMEGGFFLTGQTEYSGPEGTAKGPFFLHYDTDDKMFVYDAFNSMGEADHAKGNVSGDTWTYTSDYKMGGQSLKGRYTMKILSPTSYAMKYEMSKDGANWTTVMEGKATKK